MKQFSRILSGLLLLLLAVAAYSHELRPAYLHIEQTGAEEFAISWRVPARGDLRLSLNVQLDDSVQQLSPPAGTIANGFYTETWRVAHSNQLTGVSVTIDGLEQTMTDALVRIAWQDGREQVTRLLPEQPQFTVSGKPGNSQIAWVYFVLGMEHILLGIDHLLFVLALLFLVRGWKQLVGTVTAFTLAHSLTLAAAVLGFVNLPQAPVEAIIALSIVFVASEIVYRRHGRSTLATRKPWLVAFGFGLLHGLGFAGALSDIGVPAHALPLSLALFNIGVEAGQLVFIAAIAALFTLLWRLPPARLWQLRSGQSAAAITALPVAYVVGGLATCWLIQRTLTLVI